MSKKHARLENWDHHILSESLRGEVYDHPNFEDGTVIITSSVLGHPADNQVETHNTIYTLGKKAHGKS